MKKVALFVPCVADQFLPEIGVAAARCLAAAGCEVLYEPDHTCCGQPFLNYGYPELAARFAVSFVKRFARHETIIAPSWSCVEMVRKHYGALLSDPGLLREWEELRNRVFELTDYLCNNLAITSWPGKWRDKPKRAVIHWSCHGPKDFYFRRKVADLLGSVGGLELTDGDHDECCGFGGVFMITWGQVSEAIGTRRLKRLTDGARAELLVLGEPGCTLQLRLVSREIRVLHIAEILSEVIS